MRWATRACFHRHHILKEDGIEAESSRVKSMARLFVLSLSQACTTTTIYLNYIFGPRLCLFSRCPSEVPRNLPSNNMEGNLSAMGLKNGTNAAPVVTLCYVIHVVVYLQATSCNE